MYLIISTFSLVTLRYLLNSSYTYRFSKNVTNVLYVTVLLGLVFGYHHVEVQASYYINMIIYLCFILFLYKGNLFYSIFAYTQFALAKLFSDIVCLGYFSARMSVSVLETQNILVIGSVFILSNIITALQLYFLFRNKEIFVSFSLPKRTWFYFTLPISIVMLLLNFEWFYHNYPYLPLLFLIMCGLMLSNYVATYTLAKSLSNIKHRREIIELEAKKEISEYKSQLIQERYQTNFDFLHRFLHDSMILNELVINKDYEGLEKAVIDLNQLTIEKYNLVSSNYLILNHVIGAKLEELLTNNIKLSTTIECIDFQFIDMQDQINLLTALMDYAISACCKNRQESNLIILKTKKIQKNVAIKILFNHLEEQTSYYKIEEIVTKYDGRVSFSSNHTGCLDSLFILF